MTDPIDQIFNGEPDGIDEEELQQMQAAQEQRQAELDTEVKEMSEEDKPTESSTPAQPKEETAKAEQPEEKNRLLEAVESVSVGPVAVSDFAIDTVNLIPGVDIPKLPKFNNDVAQATREAVSVIGPTIGLTMTGVGALGAAGKASKSKILADPFVKWLGSTSASAGIGAGVDYISETSEGDNLSGTLKQSFPRTFGWIPDSIATLDSDSPDVKRMKNVSEGAGLGFFTDIVGGFAKVLANAQGVRNVTKWVPESEKAKNWLAENVDDVDYVDDADLEKARKAYIDSDLKTATYVRENPEFEWDGKIERVDPDDYTEEKVIERAEREWNALSDSEKQEFARIVLGKDVTNASAAKRSDDLDSLGAYNFSKAQNLDEPVFGIHDMYGYEEMGIRSADDLGIVGASVDQVRITKNYDTVYGRLGSVMTEPAMKYSLEGVEEYGSVMRGLRETLDQADEYGYKLTNGTIIDSKAIRSAGEELAKDLGYMTLPEMEKALKRLQTGINPDTGAPMMSSEGMTAVKIALKDAMQEYGGVADALTRVSVSGQVSDMAQASRFAEGTAGVTRTQEQILDRIELLMVANGETGKQRGLLLNLMNVFNRGDFKKPTAAELRERGADITKQLQAEAKQTVDTLREIKENRPEMLGPLLLAYENTDGNIKTIDALNNYVRQSTGVLRKAFYDGQPDIPSVVMRGFWSNVYNSTLSAFATPIKAGLSNAALLIERPIAMMAGAMIRGDGYTLRRGLYQYQAMGDTLRKGMKYMGETMRRSGLDPNYAGVAGRDDLIKRNDKQIEILNAFADAKAAEGEYGPQAMMAQIEAIQDLANHPWLRFGTRAMQAFDGFTQAVIGNVEARGRAFDMVAKGKVDADAMDDVAKKAYDEIWTKDEMGREIISDKAVKQASGEIAMNLDNMANNALSTVIERVPALKPFLLFTKTPINMMGFAASHSPMGLFIDQLEQFGRPFGEVPMDKMQRLLDSRGIPFDENAEAAYNAIRAEMKGRKAIGTVATMGAVGLFLNDSITGNGVYDRQKQRGRRSYDWKPRSIRLPGGNWVSYDNLGAITDWLALTADIMDNSDVLGEGDVAQLLSAAGFVLSASFTDKSMLAGIEPLYDILSGSPAAINRWASSFLPSATMPGASQMAELGRLISPNLRVVEENLTAMLANRTPLKATLPEEYDWIDGDKVGMPENFMARLYNTYSPWKVNGKISDVKQFLIDIEYDHRPSMKTDGKGVDLTLQEQAEVYRIMGKNGTFKKAVQRAMRSTEGKAFRERYKEFQKLGQEPRLQDFESLHIILDRELNLAKEAAISQIDMESGGAISQRRFDQAQQRRQNRMGEIENVLQYAR